MPLIDITNPDVIKFYIENYEKTTRLRMKWNSLNSDKLKYAATLQREEKGYTPEDVTKAAMVAGMPTITRDFKTGAVNKRLRPIRDGVKIPTIADIKIEQPIVHIGLGDPKEDPRLARPITDPEPDPVMRPIEQKLKNLIYKGLPRFGREVYLKSRHRIDNEDKFYFSQCDSWKYGWRLKDSYFGKQAPKYGRVWSLRRDTTGRSGPHPDPHHYRNADIPGPEKCPKI